jgi:uncharacterized protein YbcI
VPDTTNEPDAPSTTAQIARRVVHILNEFTGRGASSARVAIEGDVVTVLLRDTLTKAERSLVDDGRGQLVLEVRKAFQLTMRDELVGAVEGITGRPVVAFMSDNHLDPDLAVEVFVLAPVS